MSYDGATLPASQHSVLSPPLLAAIDSQHVFGSYDSPSQASRAVSNRATADAGVTAGSYEQPSTSSHPYQRRTRSRASSIASVNNQGGSVATSSQQNGHSNGQRRIRRSQHAQPGHSHSNSRSSIASAAGRAMTSNLYSASAASDESRLLSNSLRNRSTPHLDGLRRLSAAQEHSHSLAASAYTAPSSPHLYAAASTALAMSPLEHPSAIADHHVSPSEWALDISAPTSPHPALSRNASDYFDSALLAQLQSQNGSSHPELRPNARMIPSPPIDTAFDHLSPHAAQAVRSASQSEWAHHAAQMQQTAQLLGLQRLFASRSTPHLPDLDSAYLGHEFESPPPYAPRASAHETELDRATDLRASVPDRPHDVSSSSSAATLLNGSGNEPPLPPPISIPSVVGVNGAAGPPSASAPVRPPLRARSSSRGSRSGPHLHLPLSMVDVA